MKTASSHRNIVLFGTILLCISFAHTAPQTDPHKVWLIKGVNCPPATTDAYRGVCRQLSEFHIVSPDKTLIPYFAESLQKAGNRILHALTSSQATAKMAQNCLRTFQNAVDTYNKVANRNFQDCDRSCPAQIGEQIKNEIDAAGIGVYECIRKSIH